MMMRASGAAIEPISGGQMMGEIAREAVAAEREEAQGVANVTTMIREGRAGEAIVEAAGASGAAIEPIATHGRSGFRRAILGSVADSVVRHAPMASVLLVRAHE